MTLAQGTFRVAHLSDLHLGPLPKIKPWQLFSKRVIGYINWRRGRRLTHRGEVVEALLLDLRAQRIDHTIVSGDLVNISLPKEFVAAADWLRVLGTPDKVTVVPGNHDAYVPMAWHEAWQHWSDYMAGDGQGGVPEDAKEAFPFLRRRGRMTILGLSSAVASPPSFATGRLGRRQLGRLEGMLEAIDGGGGECRIIVLHHPPVRALTSHRRRLVDDKALGAVLARRGADLVLCGHEHELKLGRLAGPGRHGIPVVVAPSASHGASAEREGGYLVYTIEPAADGAGWRIGYELRALDAETGQFRTVKTGDLGVDAAAETKAREEAKAAAEAAA